jgi:hypothetical protein
MINKNLFIFFLLFLCFCFTNCSDDEKTEIHHLSFEKDYYERPLIEAKNIMIQGGNKDYSIKIEDPSILDVKIDLSSPIGMGDLEIYPKQKGETTIQIKDNISHETANLRIKIIDSYLHLAISNPIRPPYKQGDDFFLINNDNKDFYLYDNELKIKSTGSYKFSIEENIPYLELTYHKEFENRAIYKYSLTGTDPTMFAAIKLLLGWDWHNPIESPKTKEIAPITMKATDIKTDTEYYLTKKATDIPENVLN